MTLIAWALMALAGAGLVQCIAGWMLVRGFVAARRSAPAARPALTVLKPLYGAEPLLEDALATLCAQEYPTFQIVFGVRDDADPAVAVVGRLQERFPSRDIALVVDPASHGSNGKVSNLINMLPAARHDILVIADSDVHARPDYLDRLTAALAEPGTGLVTTLYAGLPATDRLAGRLGATQITHGFLPSALMARALGREDSLGATMMVRRETLERIGGLRMLACHLADDYVLGQLVQGLGLTVRLADAVVATTVPETTVGALYAHELRWARTIRALVPTGFALSCIQYPLFWASLAVVVSNLVPWSVATFALAWVVRGVVARGVDRALNPLLRDLAFPASIWLLPLRDIMSVAVMVASYAGRRVAWRGHTLDADDGVRATKPAQTGHAFLGGLLNP